MLNLMLHKTTIGRQIKKRHKKGMGRFLLLQGWHRSPFRLITLLDNFNLWAGLSFYTSEKTLLAAFEGFGELVEVKVITDKISKRSKGYAFVEYTTEDAATAALKLMNGKNSNLQVCERVFRAPRLKLHMNVLCFALLLVLMFKLEENKKEEELYTNNRKSRPILTLLPWQIING